MNPREARETHLRIFHSAEKTLITAATRLNDAAVSLIIENGEATFNRNFDGLDVENPDAGSTLTVWL